MVKKKAKVKKKKRSHKYDTKLAIIGTLDDVLRVASQSAKINK